MSAIRRCRRPLGLIALVAVVGVWWVAVRPSSLGGATGFVLVSGSSMEPGMHTGDLVVTRRADEYRVGQTVAYRIPAGDPAAGGVVIHRIIGGSAGSGWVTQGDNRDARDLWRPRDADVIGAQALHVPGAGRVLAYLRSPFVLACFAGLLTWSALSRRRDGAAAAPAPAA